MTEGLAAFDDWVAAHTCAAVAARSESAVAALLRATNAVLSPDTVGNATGMGHLQEKRVGAEDERERGLVAELRPALLAAHDALEAEERYWKVADPFQALPLGQLLHGARDSPEVWMVQMHVDLTG